MMYRGFCWLIPINFDLLNWLFKFKATDCVCCQLSISKNTGLMVSCDVVQCWCGVQVISPLYPTLLIPKRLNLRWVAALPLFILFAFEEAIVSSIRVNSDISMFEVLWPALTSSMELWLKLLQMFELKFFEWGTTLTLLVQRNGRHGDDQGFKFGTAKWQVVAIDEGLLHSQHFAGHSCPRPSRRGVSRWSAGSACFAKYPGRKWSYEDKTGWRANGPFAQMSLSRSPVFEKNMQSLRVRFVVHQTWWWLSSKSLCSNVAPRLTWCIYGR